MKKQQLAIITMALNGKTWIFIQFWFFSLQLNALFGSFNCDCTQFKVIQNNNRKGEDATMFGNNYMELNKIIQTRWAYQALK